MRLCGCCGWRVGWGCSVGCGRQGRVQPCDRCALQGRNRISRGLLRSMVEADARIVAPVVAATERGIVFNGRTFDFETCEDTEYGLADQVRCKERVRERLSVCLLLLHVVGRRGGDEGVYCDV